MHIPRFVLDEPFPAYTHIPGRTPHPESDPTGHSHGVERASPPPLTAAAWHESRAYLRGFDLFNHGYCWEAHEVWEGLWHACGRHGPIADFLKGLIHLAAAGVKVREGRVEGVRGHARRAADLFHEVDQEVFLGFELAELLDFCRGVEETPVESSMDTPVRPVFAMSLLPKTS